MLATTFASKIPLAPHNLSLPQPPNPKYPQYQLQPVNRRDLFTFLALTKVPFFSSAQLQYFTPFSLQVSQARGLFQMPPISPSNRYFLVRAGESEYESLGIINTNPVAKTSVDSGLSKEGKKHAVKAAKR